MGWRRSSIAVVLAVTVFEALVGAPAAAQVVDRGTGHVYQAVTVPGGITWREARLAAEAMTFEGRRGHLATVTSASELQLFFDNPELNDAMNNSFYIGGYRASASANPAHGWRWLTGETWSFTNWAVGEPNNLNGQESCLQFWTDDGTLGRWNDNPLDFPEPGFIVEFSPPDQNCRTDWNGDGVVLPADVSQFVAEWLAALSADSLAGDFDLDGEVAPADIALFVVTFFQNLNNGC